MVWLSIMCGVAKTFLPRERRKPHADERLDIHTRVRFSLHRHNWFHRSGIGPWINSLG